MIIFFFLLTGITALIVRLFGLIASGIRGHRTAKIQFMQYRLEGVFALITSVIFLRIFIFMQTEHNILFDLKETMGSLRLIPSAVTHWIGLISFLIYSYLCVMDEFGPYRIWFVKYNSLTEENKKKLLLKRDW